MKKRMLTLRTRVAPKPIIGSLPRHEWYGGAERKVKFEICVATMEW